MILLSPTHTSVASDDHSRYNRGWTGARSCSSFSSAWHWNITEKMLCTSMIKYILLGVINFKLQQTSSYLAYKYRKWAFKSLAKIHSCFNCGSAALNPSFNVICITICIIIRNRKVIHYMVCMRRYQGRTIWNNWSPIQ